MDPSAKIRRRENLFQAAFTLLATGLGAYLAGQDERITGPLGFGQTPGWIFGGVCGLIAGLFVSGLALRVVQYFYRNE